MSTILHADEGKRIGLEIPSELYRQVSQKAKQMDLSFERTAIALLRLGHDTQERREADLGATLDEFRSTADAQKKELLGDKLGGMIFGQ